MIAAEGAQLSMRVIFLSCLAVVVLEKEKSFVLSAVFHITLAVISHCNGERDFQAVLRLLLCLPGLGHEQHTVFNFFFLILL